MGAKFFAVGSANWTWEANQKFLEDAIARGDKSVLSNHPKLAVPGGPFDRELQFMAEQGFIPNLEGTALIPK